MRFSLGTRFNTLTIVLVLVSTVGTAAYVVQENVARRRDDLLRYGADLAAMLAHNSEHGLSTENAEELARSLLSLADAPDVAWVAVLDAERRVIVQRPLHSLGAIPEIGRHTPFDLKRGVEFAEHADASGRYFDLRIPVTGTAPAGEGDVLGAAAARREIIGYVRLGLSLANLRGEVTDSVVSTGFFTLTLILFGVLLTLVLTRRIVRPVQEIVRLSQEISEGRYDRRASETGRSEIGELARAFNVMAGRLASSREEVESYQRALEGRIEERTAELRLTSETLSESQRALAALVGNLPGMAYRCRYDADWTLEFVTAGCFALTGHTARELLSGDASYWRLIPDKELAALRNTVEEALRREKPFQTVYGFRTAKGEERWVWHQGRGVLSPWGEVEELDGFIADITERHLMEERMRHQDKVAAVGLLAAGVAHEVGNPLASISAVTQNLRRKAEDPQIVRKLDLISEQVQRISVILRQMGEFARPPLREWRPVLLGDVVKSAVEMLRYDRRSRAVEIELDLSPELPPTYAMRDELAQVFLNLSLNALDALDGSAPPADGGRRALRVRTALADGGAEITFEDDGPGIPAADLRRIFEPFFSTKPPGPSSGLGLGLALSQRIVEEHGGTIAAANRPEGGARFAIVLPVRDRKP